MIQVHKSSSNHGNSTTTTVTTSSGLSRVNISFNESLSDDLAQMRCQLQKLLQLLDDKNSNQEDSLIISENHRLKEENMKLRETISALTKQLLINEPQNTELSKQQEADKSFYFSPRN